MLGYGERGNGVGAERGEDFGDGGRGVGAAVVLGGVEIFLEGLQVGF